MGIGQATVKMVSQYSCINEDWVPMKVKIVNGVTMDVAPVIMIIAVNWWEEASLEVEWVSEDVLEAEVVLDTSTESMIRSPANIPENH